MLLIAFDSIIITLVKNKYIYFKLSILQNKCIYIKSAILEQLLILYYSYPEIVLRSN